MCTTRPAHSVPPDITYDAHYQSSSSALLLLPSKVTPHHVLEPSHSKFKVLFILRHTKFATPTKVCRRADDTFRTKLYKMLHELDRLFNPQISEPFQTC